MSDRSHGGFLTREHLGCAELRLPTDWSAYLDAALRAPSFLELAAFLRDERANHRVYPDPNDLFRAFELTAYEETRVVLFGQDPYHGPGQAHGLAFSVGPGVKAPPSLRNIFKELESDVGVTRPSSGDLSEWARRGVLLLNAVLTAREGEANAHQKRGWEPFTDAVLDAVNAKTEHVVFVFWGASARKKATRVDVSRHSIVEGAHPSPLSARHWFGSRPFSAVNEARRAHGQPAFDWSL
jgi:uracil-DNA glycosylase